MPYTDDNETALLKNIAVNLTDTTNFSGLTISETEIQDEFALSPRSSRYAAITRGEREDMFAGAETVLYWLTVNVHIVDYSYRDITRERNLIGDGTTPGLAKEADVIRRALVRPSPYDKQKPSGTPPTGTYTTQADVKQVQYLDTEDMGDEDKASYLDADGEPDEAQRAQVCVASLRYMIVDDLN